MAQSENNLDIRREEGLLSWIQQSAPYGVVMLNKSLQVQSWNVWMEQHSGALMKDVINRDIFEIFPGLKERNAMAIFQRALKGESCVLSTSLHQYLLPLPSPLRDSSKPYMRQTARLTPLMEGEAVQGIVIVIEDVTQRESHAEILRLQHRRDEILSWALAHFLKSEEPRKTVRQLFFKIAEHMDFDTFFLYLREFDTGNLALYGVGGVSVELEKEFAGYPLFFQLAESVDSVVLNSLKGRQETEYALLEKVGVAAALVIPLAVNTRNVGLLCFATWSRETIAPEELDLIKTIAQYLATAVDRENTNLQLQKARVELLEHSQLLERRVEERTARLLETISELETFSYTLAHDLKAPVRGMTGFSQVLLKDFAEKLPPGANLLIKKMLRSSQRMEVLIHDLLAFSRISRDPVVLSPVEIEPLLDEILALRVPTVHHAITVQSPLHLVSAQKPLLQQVLSNLIDNAIKFVDPQTKPQITILTEIVPRGSPSTRSGPLLFNATESAATFNGSDTTSEQTKVRIWVKDNGIGIPPEAHQKIFGIFERSTNSHIYEGTGMGLAIVARAVQRMGGTCGVESDVGVGSRFWIELNLVENPD